MLGCIPYADEEVQCILWRTTLYNKIVVGYEDVMVEMQFDPFDKGNYSPYYKRSSPTHTLHVKEVRPTFITR